MIDTTSGNVKSSTKCVVCPQPGKFQMTLSFQFLSVPSTLPLTHSPHYSYFLRLYVSIFVKFHFLGIPREDFLPKSALYTIIVFLKLCFY